MVKSHADVVAIVTRYAEALSSEIDVDKIILLGAYATGGADEWSDIEFAVISNDFADMRYVDRLDLLALKTMGIDSFLMPIGGYTPDEYEHPEKTLHMRWTKAKGKIVYSREEPS